MMLAGFPDNSGPQSMEGRLFYNYQLNHISNGTTQNATYSPVPNSPYNPTYDTATAAARAANALLLNWSNSEIAAASGYSTHHSVRQQLGVQCSDWSQREIPLGQRRYGRTDGRPSCTTCQPVGGQSEGLAPERS